MVANEQKAIVFIYFLAYSFLFWDKILRYLDQHAVCVHRTGFTGTVNRITWNMILTLCHFVSLKC